MTTTWDPESFTRSLMEDMRNHNGKLTSGPMEGQPLLILTTKGAKTGQPRVVIVTWTRDGDAYVVAGSKGGAPTDPVWLKNLVANPEATIEVDGRTLKVRAEVAKGADRDRLWDRHVQALPAFAEYPKTSGRTIPMVRLTPVR
jgi:deazaflavin-dependent oxidoreductase (nitroreductase family)